SIATWSRLTVMRSFVVVWLVTMTAACAGQPAPAALNPRADACGSCRMIVADQHFASQIVTPNPDPRFFDDFGCLQRYLAQHPLPAGAVIFVADHRTGEWIAADSAVFSRVDALAAPMGSHVVAHASAPSRQADPSAASAVAVDPQTLFPQTPRKDDRP